MILVIAEKPSVAQTIAAVLGAKEKKDGFLTGSGYLVSWCVGHLVGLSEAAAYGEQYKKLSLIHILTEDILSAWSKTLSGKSKTVKEKLAVVRGFGKYLNTLGHQSFLPTLPKVKSD